MGKLRWAHDKGHWEADSPSKGVVYRITKQSRTYASDDQRYSYEAVSAHDDNDALDYGYYGTLGGAKKRAQRDEDKLLRGGGERNPAPAKTLKQRLNAWKRAADKDFARELALTAENEGSLYPQRQAIEKSLVNKHASGKYDHDKAIVAWGNWMDSAGKKYKRDYGIQPDKATRMTAAAEYAGEFRAAMKGGEYDHHLHKKHQKRRNPVVHAPLKSHYSYDVRGPQGGRYMTTTEAEAKKLTRNGGSYRRIKKFGQKWDATVHRRAKNPRLGALMISKTAEQTGYGSDRHKRVRGLTEVERKHVRKGGVVAFEAARLSGGSHGSYWRIVIEGRNRDFYPRVPDDATLKKIRRKVGGKNPRGHLPVDSAGEGIAFRHKYLDMFFAEKDLPIKTWTIEAPDGTSHIINSNVVLEHLAQAPKSEKDQIADIIRKIDFANGDVNHLLHHLAGAIAANYGQ